MEVTIRDLLQEITHEAIVGQHAPRIEEARAQFGHSIAVLTTEGDNRCYNCVMYALGIEADREYFVMSTYCPEHVHASTDFLQFLYDEGHFVERQESAPGCLIVYSHKGRFRHIGRIVGEGRVRSKWGIGHLYEHTLLKAPNSYGTEIRFFEPVDRDNALDAFYAYAKRRGVKFPAAVG